MTTDLTSLQCEKSCHVRVLVMRCVAVTLLLVPVLLSPGLFAQGLTTTIAPTTGNADSTQIAVPGGAGATVSGSGTAGAGPIIGFQVWHQDKYLLSTFFTLSAPQAVNGVQKDFGSFLLNAPGQGTSYSFSGNRVWPVLNGAVFVGVAGRLGVTQTTWQLGSSTGSQSIPGSIFYATPAFLFTSKTYPVTIDSDTNEYQFGFSIGPSFRDILGDLSQSTNSDFLQQALGTTKKFYIGPEFEFFVRLNQFRPYLRLTRFSSPSDISSFSGTQVVFGVDVLSAIFKKSLN